MHMYLHFTSNTDDTKHTFLTNGYDVIGSGVRRVLASLMKKVHFSEAGPGLEMSNRSDPIHTLILTLLLDPGFRSPTS